MAIKYDNARIFCGYCSHMWWGMKWNAGQRLKYVPIWAFHGKKDTTVFQEESIWMVDAVNKAGGSAKLTLLDDVGHSSWEYAYAHREVYDWLLLHRKEREVKVQNEEFTDGKIYG